MLVLDRDRLYRGTSQSDEKSGPRRLNEPRSVATRHSAKEHVEQIVTAVTPCPVIFVSKPSV